MPPAVTVLTIVEQGNHAEFLGDHGRAQFPIRGGSMLECRLFSCRSFCTVGNQQASVVVNPIAEHPMVDTTPLIHVSCS
jgi:hypothetical protein